MIGGIVATLFYGHGDSGDLTDLLFGHRFDITDGVHMLRICFAFSALALIVNEPWSKKWPDRPFKGGTRDSHATKAVVAA